MIHDDINASIIVKDSKWHFLIMCYIESFEN